MWQILNSAHISEQGVKMIKSVVYSVLFRFLCCIHLGQNATPQVIGPNTSVYRIVGPELQSLDTDPNFTPNSRVFRARVFYSGQSLGNSCTLAENAVGLFHLPQFYIESKRLQPPTTEQCPLTEPWSIGSILTQRENCHLLNLQHCLLHHLSFPQMCLFKSRQDFTLLSLQNTMRSQGCHSVMAAAFDLGSSD